MAVLDDNDPIVLLSTQVIKVVSGHDGHTVMAALASTLGASLSISTERAGYQPVEVAALQSMLHDLVGDIIAARSSTSTRES